MTQDHAPPTIAFIGGGNMASAIVGGPLTAGRPAASFSVVEPYAPAREALRQEFGITPLDAADASLAGAAMSSGRSSRRESPTRRHPAAGTWRARGNCR